jgi:hypothetical protein
MHPLSHDQAACQTTAAQRQTTSCRPSCTPSSKTEVLCIYWRAYTIPGQMKKTPTPASRGSLPMPPNNAEIVFARVLQLLLQQQNGSNVPGQDWLKKKHTIADVQEAVTKAQEKYNLRSKDSKVRKWLARFSTGVLHYGRILDVLVQHHPEYVSLAWGTTKLLFVVSSQKYTPSDRPLGRHVYSDRYGRRWHQPATLDLSLEEDHEDFIRSRTLSVDKQTRTALSGIGRNPSHLTCPSRERHS